MDRHPVRNRAVISLGGTVPLIPCIFEQRTGGIGLPCGFDQMPRCGGMHRKPSLAAAVHVFKFGIGNSPFDGLDSLFRRGNLGCPVVYTLLCVERVSSVCPVKAFA